MEEQILKTVKEVFKDYDFTSFALSEAKVVCANIYKKTNTLELKLQATSSILIKDLTDFEKYLIKRFGFQNIEIKIGAPEEEKSTEENVDNKIDVNKKIQLEWQEIVEYMAYKHPLTKALLKNSTISIENNKIIVHMPMKGKGVLEARGFDRILATKLQDLYHKKYVLNFQEEITQEMLEQYQEHSKELEKQAVLLVQKEVEEQAQEKQLESGKAKQKTVSKQSQQNTNKVEGATTSEASGGMPPPWEEVPAPEEPEEVSPIIYGRSMKIKEELSKVADLSVDSGKVLLDGEILNTDSRELKSGKFLVTFDLYDGSSTITCKAFAEADKHDSVVKRLKDAKGVKVSGTAQFDPFAKELLTNVKQCQYLNCNKCSIKSISCKLFTCNSLQKKGIKYDTHEILLLDCFFNNKQHLILSKNFFKTKEEIINKLLEKNYEPYFLYYIKGKYRI